MSTTPLLCLIPSRMPLSFFSYINSQHPNIKFTMEKEENHKLPFLDELLDNHSNQGIITSVFHKKTYTGLLTNYYSLVPFSYKLGLVRTLVDRAFKINNRDFTIYDGDVDENVTSKYNFALS